jgi:hypothetical protein
MRIFKTDPPSSITIQTLATVFPSLPNARAANPAGTAPRPALMRAFPTPRSATDRESRARRGPVRLAITTVPENAPTPENRDNPAKPFPQSP